MSEFYRTIKNLRSSNLIDYGFKSDSLKEGFYKKIPHKDSYVFFHIMGSWNYIDLRYGIRFPTLNRVLEESAREAGWKKIKSESFRLMSIGMFEQKIGDYCECGDDIGITCPETSITISIEDICELIISKFESASQIGNLHDALMFCVKNGIRYDYSMYMLTSGAIMCREHVLYRDLVREFTSEMDIKEKLIYEYFLYIVEKNIYDLDIYH